MKYIVFVLVFFVALTSIVVGAYNNINNANNRPITIYEALFLLKNGNVFGTEMRSKYQDVLEAFNTYRDVTLGEKLDSLTWTDWFITEFTNVNGFLVLKAPKAWSVIYDDFTENNMVSRFIKGVTACVSFVGAFFVDVFYEIESYFVLARALLFGVDADTGLTINGEPIPYY